MEILQKRRQLVRQQLGDDLLILPTRFDNERQDDGYGYYSTRYGYRHWRGDSDFLYLTGFNEPQSVLLMTADEEILFCLPHDAQHEQWHGERAGPEGASLQSGIGCVLPIQQLDTVLRERLPRHPGIQVPFGADCAFDHRLLALLNNLNTPRHIRQGLSCPTRLLDPRPLLHEMRKIKDAHELACMREGMAITARAMQRAMQGTRPGRFEFELEADIQHEFRRHGCLQPAYNLIVGGGRNSCILHYTDNRHALRDGDMLLIDAGCEWQFYNTDITRSFPVNGRFNPAQRDLYQLVLAAEQAGIARIRPGQAVTAPHEACVRTISQGLIDLGLCRGSLDGVIASGAYKRFFMHGSGHWLGLDTHDVGRVHGEHYRPGMVTTIEPGLYITPADDIPEAMWHIGIRIEDNVLVTPEGHEVLSQSIPVQIADIEAAMRG